MVVTFGKNPAQTVPVAFNNLTKSNLPKAEAAKDFKTIVKAVRKDPDKAFAELGQAMKTKSQVLCNETVKQPVGIDFES